MLNTSKTSSSKLSVSRLEKPIPQFRCNWSHQLTSDWEDTHSDYSYRTIPIECRMSEIRTSGSMLQQKLYMQKLMVEVILLYGSGDTILTMRLSRRESAHDYELEKNSERGCIQPHPFIVGLYPINRCESW